MITRCINKVIIFSKANQKVGELGQTRIIFVFEKLRNFSFFWQKCDNNIFTPRNSVTVDLPKTIIFKHFKIWGLPLKSSSECLKKEFLVTLSLYFKRRSKQFNFNGIIFAD